MLIYLCININLRYFQIAFILIYSIYIASYNFYYINFLNLIEHVLINLGPHQVYLFIIHIRVTKTHYLKKKLY